MASIPWKCGHCGKYVHHYSCCSCPDGRLQAIDAERKAIDDRLNQLNADEREILGLVAEQS